MSKPYIHALSSVRLDRVDPSIDRTDMNEAAKDLLQRARERTNFELLCEIGSTSHGTGDGNDDFDMMGVFIESKEQVIGQSSFDHVVMSSGDNESQNTKEDADLTLYSLRKFSKLAAAGNPSILNVFFAPMLSSTPLGLKIREAAPLFISKQAGPRYLGYMQGQMQRLKGERSQNVKRPELVSKYGYDTKFAYHILRLAWQGQELMLYGKVNIPIKPHMRNFLVGVRKGELDLPAFMERAGHEEEMLKKAIDISQLPERSDASAIDKWLVEIHEEAWANTEEPHGKM